MLDSLEVDYTNNKVTINIDKLYKNVDIDETLSNLTGKWIKSISEDELVFEDGEKINKNELDYKWFKNMIWWES